MSKRFSLAIALSLALPLLGGSPAVHAQEAGGQSAHIDRLMSFCKLWAAVKYFHPYLAYRDDIDWDAALVTTLPKVSAAKNAEEYGAAVQSILEKLGDPASHVVRTGTSSVASSGRQQPTFRLNAENILFVSMTNYADLTDFIGMREKMAAVIKELPKARAVVFDLRPQTPPARGEQGWASYAISSSGIAEMLTPLPLKLPGERQRMHVGFPPQKGPPTGGYSSGFYFRARMTISPASAAKEMPVAFLVNENADLPPIALALQAAGKAVIVAEGGANDEGLVNTRRMELGEGVAAEVRLGEIVYDDGTSGFQPNLAVPVSSLTGEENPAFQAAVEQVKNWKPAPPVRKPISLRMSPPLDKGYADMKYPPPEYRMLAAFRIWAVIDYFFPYREFLRENWDDVLREFIPRMESAANALDYHLAVSEMVTHIHDTHGFMSSPVLSEHFGNSRGPLRVRMIEGVPVVTGFIDANAAKAAGVEIGDVIVKVDGEDASERIRQRLKYIAHSTPQSGMFDAADRWLLLGSKDSAVSMTLRDRHNQEKVVKLPRKSEYVPRTRGGRTGEILVSRYRRK